MAVTAKATGNWSALSTWTSGSLPGAGDDVDSNGYTVTIDQNITVASLIGTSAGVGGFSLTTAYNITANITASVRTVLTCNHASGTCNILGTLTGATLNVFAMRNSGAGSLNITGTLTSSGAGYALYVAGNGATVALTCAGGVSVRGVRNNSTSQITITGDVTATNIADVVSNESSGRFDIVGSVTGGSAGSCYGVQNISTGTMTVSGNATGGSNATTYGAYNASTGTLNVNQAIAGSVVGAHGLYGANSGGTTTYKQVGSQANGNSAVGGFCKMLIDATNQITVKRSDTGADYILRPGGAGGRFGLASGGIL
jgi:hypothetical protein